MSSASEFLERLRRDGWVRSSQARLTPLSGGVSSEIYLVEDDTERFVVKRALPKLKVRDDWFADVSRNASEHACLECVGRLLPGVVPRVRFANAEAGYFGMEYLGDGFANWKQLLLHGVFEVRHARRAGLVLGEIHRRTAGDAELQRCFDTTANFHQLRTAPYLLTSGERQPALRDYFVAEARRLEATRECLVHGDFSPKNILLANERLVVLDCEVAWYGDPAFDAAFLLNHLFLKRLYHAPRGGELRELIGEFWREYLTARPAPGEGWEERVVNLLLLLLLARVDGKSPVEYLDPRRVQFVRDFVRGCFPAGDRTLRTLVDAWFARTHAFPAPAQRS